MTADQLILDALRITPMTGSEIGKGFAPEHIKDRAGWGRKWLARNAEAAAAANDARRNRHRRIEKVYDGPDFTRVPAGVFSEHLNQAQLMLSDWLFTMPRSYKHILAPRGTLPRPHHPRHTRRFRFCNN
jgi:hypothetical protein